MASGLARVITDVAQLNQFRPGEVLVADTTAPDWGTVVGCDNATESIQTGDEVTVSCAEGDAGHVYAGRIPFEVVRTNLSSLRHPQTQLMVNLGNPDIAFQTSFLPADGVGLARMES